MEVWNGIWKKIFSVEWKKIASMEYEKSSTIHTIACPDCQYGIWKNRLLFCTMPCKNGNKSNCSFAHLLILF